MENFLSRQRFQRYASLVDKRGGGRREVKLTPRLTLVRFDVSESGYACYTRGDESDG